MARPCPICGKADGTCGDQPLVFPPIDLLKGATVADDKIYVPEQKTRRGVPGYRGSNVVVVSSDGNTQKPAESGKGKKGKK